jgi:hypothetical protein
LERLNYFIYSNLYTTKNNIKNYFAISLIILSASSAIVQNHAFAFVAPSLGAAGTFGILASTYTNTATPVVITGDLGYITAPATPPSTLTGTLHVDDTTFTNARTAEGTALSSLNGDACTFTFAAGAIDLASDTTHGPIGVYTPGVYCVTGAMSIASTPGITLNGAGAYLFRSTGALNTAVNTAVTLEGGASANDVFWTPGAATTLGANTAFVGIDIDDSGIVIGGTTAWVGQALAAGGTVSTATTDSITVPTVAPAAITLTPSTDPVGTLVTVAGTGFADTSLVTIKYNTVGQTTGGTCTTSGSGVLAGCTFTVPSGVIGAANTVLATDASGDTAVATFTVPPLISLSPALGSVGTTVTVSGSDFADNSAVTIKYDGTTVTTSPATVTTTGTGAIPSGVTFTVPASALGPNTVTATDASSNTASASFILTTLTAPSLATSNTFSVLASTGVSNDPTLGTSTVITGNLGITPNGASSITGFPPGTFTAEHANDAVAIAGLAAANTAFTNLNSNSCTTIYPAVQDLGGLTLTPGVYCDPSSFSINSGETLTLNGAGVYVFKAGSTLTTVTNANVVLTGGATAANVFWAVGSSATLAAPGSVATSPKSFQGTIIAQDSISETGGTTGTILAVDGRLIALTGAVSFASSTTVTNPAAPSITLNPPADPVGTTVLISGSGFADASLVIFTYDGAPLTTSPAAVTTTAGGAIPSGVTFTVPSSTGANPVVATDASSNAASATYTVQTVTVPEFPLGGMVLLAVASMGVYLAIRYKAIKPIKLH